MAAPTPMSFWRDAPTGVRRVLSVVAAVHLALFLRCVQDPSVLGLHDRAIGRLQMADRLLAALGSGDVAKTLGTQTVIGDYAPHALMLALSGGWWPGLVVCQLLLQVWALRELFGLARVLGASRPQAWWTVAAYAAIPIDLMVPHAASSESVFLPLVIAGMHELAKAAQGSERMDRLRSTARAGLLCGLATLVRPEWQLPTAVLVATLLWHRRQDGWRRAVQQVVVFGVPWLAVVAAWLLTFHACSGLWGFGAAGVDLRATVAVRVQELATYSGHPLPPGTDGASLVTWVNLSLAEPWTALRVTLSHIAKFIALPENLDLAAYFGLYERTGVRAIRMEQLGPIRGLWVTLVEMPVLVSWLMLEVAAFLWLWSCALRGLRWSWQHLRTVRWLHVGLWCIVAVYVAERALMEGGSRKRAPIDMVIALAAGLWLGRPAVRDPGAADRS